MHTSDGYTHTSDGFTHTSDGFTHTSDGFTHTSDGYENVSMLVTDLLCGSLPGWPAKLLTGCPDNFKSPWEEKCKRCDNKVFHSVEVEETHGVRTQ